MSETLNATNVMLEPWFMTLSISSSGTTARLLADSGDSKLEGSKSWRTVLLPVARRMKRRLSSRNGVSFSVPDSCFLPTTGHLRPRTSLTGSSMPRQRKQPLRTEEIRMMSAADGPTTPIQRLQFSVQTRRSRMQ